MHIKRLQFFDKRCLCMSYFHLILVLFSGVLLKKLICDDVVHFRCVVISSLAFNNDSMFLCASSNTETVHVFKLEMPKDK